MIKSIVLTGATSSIGTALIDVCIENGIKVLALVNPGSKNVNRITKSPLVNIQECSLESLCNFDLLQEPNDKDFAPGEDINSDSCYDAFIHLAWAATAGDQQRNLLVPQVNNIKFALDAVELAYRLGCKAFVGSGSQAEYGRTDKILTEELIAKPETAYGMAKLCAGQMTRLACNQKGIRHIWPRILSAFGPKCQPQSVINYTITELLKGNVPMLSGGEQIWDFIYTKDVARALLLLADKGKDSEIYVIGSGKSDLLKNYLIKARDIINPDLDLGFGQKPYGTNAVMHLECDISKLKKDTGFELKYSFEEGIKKTIEWLKAQDDF